MTVVPFQRRTAGLRELPLVEDAWAAKAASSTSGLVRAASR